MSNEEKIIDLLEQILAEIKKPNEPIEINGEDIESVLGKTRS